MATPKKAVEEPEIIEAPQEERKVQIRLPLTKELQDDVFVRVNQRTWQIKRGVTVEVPECVAEVLEHAEENMLAAIEYINAHSTAD